MHHIVEQIAQSNNTRNVFNSQRWGWLRGQYNPGESVMRIRYQKWLVYDTQYKHPNMHQAVPLYMVVAARETKCKMYDNLNSSTRERVPSIMLAIKNAYAPIQSSLNKIQHSQWYQHHKYLSNNSVASLGTRGSARTLSSTNSFQDEKQPKTHL